VYLTDRRDTSTNLLTAAPQLPDVGVLALVPDRWGGPWLSRHQILTRLAAYFNVVWVNPAPSWRRFWLSTPPRNREADSSAAITPGFTIYNPERWLPEIGRPPFMAHWTLQQRLRRAKQILLKRGCRDTILYLWRPTYEPSSEFDGLRSQLLPYRRRIYIFSS